MNSLYSKTSNTHHDATSHPFGKKLLDGDVTKNEWADWLHLQLQVYTLIDPFLPADLRRSDLLFLDLLKMLPTRGNPSTVFNTYVSDRKDRNDFYHLGGLLYLMIGINLRGSQIVAKKLIGREGFSCHGVTYEPEQSAKCNAWVKEHLRDISSLAEDTKNAFDMMINAMEEILQRHNSNN